MFADRSGKIAKMVTERMGDCAADDMRSPYTRCGGMASTCGPGGGVGGGGGGVCFYPCSVGSWQKASVGVGSKRIVDSCLRRSVEAARMAGIAAIRMWGTVVAEEKALRDRTHQAVLIEGKREEDLVGVIERGDDASTREGTGGGVASGATKFVVFCALVQLGNRCGYGLRRRGRSGSNLVRGHPWDSCVAVGADGLSVGSVETDVDVSGAEARLPGNDVSGFERHLGCIVNPLDKGAKRASNLGARVAAGMVDGSFGALFTEKCMIPIAITGFAAWAAALGGIFRQDGDAKFPSDSMSRRGGRHALSRLATRDTRGWNGSSWRHKGGQMCRHCGWHTVNVSCERRTFVVERDMTASSM